jgi:DNA replication protein DnaC
MNTQLSSAMRQLKLSGMLATLDVRCQEAAGNNLTHAEFLELLIQDELNVRKDRSLKRRIKAADFRRLHSLVDFDFTFNPNINQRQIMGLATCNFIRDRGDILFLGPPGVGKTHLAVAIALEAIRQQFRVLYRSIFDCVGDMMQSETLNEKPRTLKKYLKADLLLIDDMGLKTLPKTAAEHLFEIIMRRHQVKSTIMTSNRPLEEWGKLLGDIPTTSAILDRFLATAEVVKITGRSYRVKGKTGNKEQGDGTN